MHHGLHGGGLHRQVEPGGKPDAPQDAQRVFPEAPVRLSHTAENALFQVCLAAKGVGVSAPGGPGNCIDGEVPSGQVGFDIRHEFHPPGVAVIVIAALRAEGGDLCHAAGEPQTHGAVADAHGILLYIPENSLDLLRPCPGGDVVVIGRQPQQFVADAAAHQIGGIARLLQGAEDPFGLGTGEHLSPPQGEARHTCSPARWQRR